MSSARLPFLTGRTFFTTPAPHSVIRIRTTVRLPWRRKSVSVLSPVSINPPHYDPPGVAPLTTQQVVGLLSDESPEIRLAASVWLFEENELWWIEQLDEPLRKQVEEKLVTTFRKRLQADGEMVRNEAARSLARLRTLAALRVLIETLEDPDYPHTADVVLHVGVVLYPRMTSRTPYFPHRFGPGQGRAMRWSVETLLRHLRTMAGHAGAKFPAAVPTPKCSKEEHDRLFRTWVRDLRSDREDVRSTAAKRLAEVRDGRATGPLVFALRDASEDVREAAARSLGELKDRRAVEPLLFALRDSANVRAAAAHALGEIGDARAGLAVRPLIDDFVPEVRREAVHALASFGDPAAFDFSIKAVKDEDRDVRLSAVAALRHFEGRQATEAIVRVAKADADDDVRLAAVEILAERKDTWVFDGLVAALDEESWHFRYVAFKALAELGDPRAPAFLLATVGKAAPCSWPAVLELFPLVAIKRLKKDDIWQPLLDSLAGDNNAARVGAALALGYLEDADAVEPLIAALGRDDPVLRQYAIWALMRLGDRRAVAPLIAELKREFSWSRVDAALALGRLGDARAVDPLCELLKNEDPLLRRAAAVSLGMLGVKKAADPLLTMLDDDDERVTTDAAEALALIGDERAAGLLAGRLAKWPPAPETRFPGESPPASKYVSALFALGWKPKSFEDCVRLLALYNRQEFLAALALEPVIRVESGEAQAPNFDAETQVREHPLAPALRIAREGLENIRNNVRDYSCTLVKRERVDGKLLDAEYIFTKIRRERLEDGRVKAPFSVYMRFVAPKAIKGREVLYIKGQNNGKLLGHEGGRLKAIPAVWLDPDSRGTRNKRYPITEVGIENLVGQLIEVAEEDSKYGECEVYIFDNAKVNGRACKCIHVIHPVPRKNFRFHKAQIFIDQELNLPIRYASWSWPTKKGGAPVLLEEYTYTNLKLNCGFTDDDFNRDNPTYDFRRGAGEEE